ncbi:pentatricopeptide repeat-containing protein At1g19720-like [Selaginella moellendorffii]|uniref:pentatricopeptide repeat-containing protein At1g19720-like n=1 Tax=Selaginella moellendorffii TaxID=88036 RepID=UPI000D1C94E9|nr:pentatricopeptide repeat-containing protein At1g19720-like [Selaginella moellendorffii]|eukprot:XP_024533425.1 pentatricopeptide repeat-containing protein At1g19720-like [Selaginella moellendorffii]
MSGNTSTNFAPLSPPRARSSSGTADDLARRIRASGESKHLAEANRLDAEIAVSSEHRRDRYLANLLIEAFGKCECLASARRVFDSIDEPNIFSWSIIISAYAQNGQVEIARDLYEGMPTKNVISGNALIAAYAQSGNIQAATSMFRLMTQRDIVTWNTLLAAYSQQGHLADAKRTFGSMPERDVVSWTTMLGVYCQDGNLEGSERIFNLMPEKNIASWNALLAAYTQNRHLDGAKETFALMPYRNLVSWTTLMEAYAKSGNLSDAKETFDQMPERNLVSWTVILLAYAQLGHMDNVREMLDEIPQTDSVLLTAMITSFARSGHLMESKDIFFGRMKGCKSLVSWNAMLDAYALNACYEQALKLLEFMSWEGVRPDAFTFVTILTASSHLGEIERCREAFVSMAQDHGMTPELEHYSCMIDILGRGGRLDKAEDLIRNMPFQPEPVLWLTLLAACKMHGDLDRAARIGEEVSRLDPQRGSTSYGTALQQVIRSKDICRAKSIHAKLQDKQQDGNTFLGNLLVQMYGSCGSIQESRLAFDTIQRKNVFSWNIMVSAFAHNGYLQETMAAFGKMPSHNVVSWNAVAAALVQSGSLEDARQVFLRMPEKNLVSWNALLGLHAQAGHLVDAKQIFDEMPQRDVVSWNTLLSTFGHDRKQHSIDSAMLVFDRIPQHSVVTWNSVITANALAGHLDTAKALFFGMPERDAVSWNSIVAGFVQGGRIADGKIIFRRMPFQDLVSRNAVAAADALEGDLCFALRLFEQTRSAIMGTALISAYTASNRLEEARKIFAMIQDQDVISWTSMIAGCAANQQLGEARLLFDRIPQRDTISWTSMIASYAQAGDLQESMSLFSAAPHRDGVSYNAMIQAYVVSGKLNQARAFFEQMCVDGQHNPGSWNTIIAAYSQIGQSQEALRIFRRMDLEGVPANGITLICALDACTSIAALELGRIIHAHAIAARLFRDVGVATQLIDMYAKCGKLRDARRVFDKMEERNTLTWNTVIAAYQGHGQNPCDRTGHVLGLFLAMVSEGFEPSDVTMLSVISAFSHAGLLEESSHYFVSSSWDFGVAVKLDHYQCVIDLLSRLGELGTGEELVERMPFEPDLTAWKTLLSACRVHGDCERAVRAAVNILELDPDDGSIYALLANTYTSDLELKTSNQTLH